MDVRMEGREYGRKEGRMDRRRKRKGGRKERRKETDRQTVTTRESEQKNKHFNKYVFMLVLLSQKWAESVGGHLAGRACTGHAVRSGTFTPGRDDENSPAVTSRKKSLLPGRWRSADAAFSTTNSQR